MYVPDPGLKFKLEQLLYDTGELYLDLKVCSHFIHCLCFASLAVKEQRKIRRNCQIETVATKT